LCEASFLVKQQKGGLDYLFTGTSRRPRRPRAGRARWRRGREQ
jgi:hypothetical protein